MIAIERYERLPATCLPYHPRAPAVAALLAAAIGRVLPEVTVEHIGSTAIPGCAGKGIVDLLVIYPVGGLVRAREALLEMGFQRQGGPDPWPEERPMRVGAIQYGGTQFRIHAHVVAANTADATTDVAFRDRMRVDPALVRAYVAQKRAIVGSGVTDGLEYTERKSPFIQGVLGVDAS